MLNIIDSLKPEMPTVLFLAGSLTNPCVYDQIESDGVFQFGAVDYCRSQAPWDVTTLGKRIIEAIDILKLGPTVLAGYSAGGVIAMAAAAYAPEKIAGLMLSNTGPCGKGHGDPDFPRKLITGWGTKEFTDNFFKRCFSREIPPFLKYRLEQYIAVMDKHAGYEVSRSLREVDYSEKLKAVSCPVVIAHGTLDTARTQAHVDMMTDCMPQAKVFYLEGGHTIMVENKEEWQRAFFILLADVKRKYFEGV